MSHASPERPSPEPGRVIAGTGRHGGRRRRSGQAAGADQGDQHKHWQLPYLLVLLGALAGLAIIRQGVHLVRSGTLVLAGVLLVAAVARLVLPERRAGLLSSRRRLLDVAIFGVLGVGLLVAGLVVPVPG